MNNPNDIPTTLPPIDASTQDEIYGLPSPANRSLSDLISPDDWRLYHLMRELTNDDRHSILTFAEMLYSLREARRRVETHDEAMGDRR
jgi:hypothetical protein